ncbi:hypothetical protein BDZ94DRAFT_1262667 [Collybia nuda]|uniref:Uncharacterized protein n=1 Tax=Collybia nuda TaxID=64659 RepID=A0A9P6CIE4_9AGAR|nr:hypothetical protein BDZ94DRAFT_1262667 [Collybia nuda]
MHAAHCKSHSVHWYRAYCPVQCFFSQKPLGIGRSRFKAHVLYLMPILRARNFLAR